MPLCANASAGNWSSAAQEKLDQFQALVRQWNPAINLVSKSSLSDLAGRHIADSAQIFRLAPENSGHWVDLGSGGGFPAIVVAILAADNGNSTKFTLVESDMRKATFLRQAIRVLALQAEVINSRIEDIKPLSADVLSARALAPLSKLCGFAERHLAKAGVAIFPKGAQHEVEVAEARKTWHFELVPHQSMTDQRASVLMLRDIRHV